MTNSRIQGVIFDLDGTLYELPRRKLHMILAMLGDIGMLRHVGVARRALRDRSFGDRESLRAQFYQELGRRCGTTPERAGAWYEARFMEEFVSLLARRARPRPGLLELLTELRRRGIRLAVVSDFGRVKGRLEALRIPHYLFDDAVGAEDFGVLKPTPLPFTVLAEKWGLEPTSLVVVGDRWDLDGASAEAAGMEFIGVAERTLLGLGSADGLIGWDEAAGQLELRTRHDLKYEN